MGPEATNVSPEPIHARFASPSLSIAKPSLIYSINSLDKIPKIYACYAWLLGEQYLYIGKSTKVGARIKYLVPVMKRRLAIEFNKCIIHIWRARKDDGLDLGLLECQLINKFHPKYNKNSPRFFPTIYP